jgi:hypothetical protein
MTSNIGLRNNNKINQPQTIWRYAHFHSYMPFDMKKSIMMACLKKTDKMASDSKILYQSGFQKICEYLNLLLGLPGKHVCYGQHALRWLFIPGIQHGLTYVTTSTTRTKTLPNKAVDRSGPKSGGEVYNILRPRTADGALQIQSNGIMYRRLVVLDWGSRRGVRAGRRYPG